MIDLYTAPTPNGAPSTVKVYDRAGELRLDLGGRRDGQRQDQQSGDQDDTL